MTTKYKIVLGFVLMIFLLGGVAFLGYRDLQNVSDGFINYRREARLNVGTSDMLATLNLSVARAYSFILSSDMALMENAITQTDNFEKLVNGLEGDAVAQKHKDALQQARKEIQGLKAGMNTVRNALPEFKRQYATVARPAYTGMIELLEVLGKLAYDRDNLNALYRVSESWKDFGSFLSTLVRYSETRSEEDSRQVREQLENVGKILAGIGEVLYTEEGKKTFADLMASYETLKNVTRAMDANATQTRKNILDMHSASLRVIQFCTDVSADTDESMRNDGTRMLSFNDTAQRDMFLISLVGVLIGIALAAFIIFGIIRMLKDISQFADAVAAGNFKQTVKTREKGEIGQMIASLRQIPETLEQLIAAAGVTARDIRRGKLRNRLDGKVFSGEFNHLATSVNALADAYTGILDALPVPLMTCDKTFTVSFYNKPGQAMVGGNLVNTSCAKNLGAPECSTGNCFGKRCMEQGTTIQGETVVGPEGHKKHLALIDVPLKELNGETVGFVEMLTDLTEIRTQQDTMLQVARQASEISARVAAASEKVSSQVEQISRSAEVQRARVESTASAMTEMNSTVLEVARNAGQGSEQSESTRLKAESGAGLVNQVMDAINLVNTVGQNMQNNMQELGKQAESIGGVMNVISDIADQTNLLALNAAIEAARAGEAGRGFAVVADEVRKLAEKTMQATQEVGASINAVQHSARVNIDEVGRAVSSVAEANELAKASGEALAEIVALASSNSAVVASIATAAEEQSATSEEINRSVEEINQIVGETAEGMIQSSAAVQELLHLAQELRRVMERLG